MKTKLPFLGFVLILGIKLGLAVAGSPQVHQVSIKAGTFKFTPETLTIRTGDTVRWVNEDPQEAHFLIDDFFSQPGAQPEIVSKTLQPGEMTEHTFLHPGRFPYHCFFHFQQHQMKGVVIVEGEDLAPLPF